MTAWTGLTVFADGNETLTVNLVKIKINKKTLHFNVIETLYWKSKNFKNILQPV